jgi:AraC family transcriptional regulator, arabinose operon regulatory protein
MSNTPASSARSEKGEGFPGQRIVVLPRAVVTRARTHPLLRGLLPTDAGYFPKAVGHLRERQAGVDQAIFIYCAQGTGWCEIEGRRHEVHPGDLLVLPPEVAHAYGADTQHPWTLHWFHATGGDIPHLLGELAVSAASPVLFLGQDPRLLGLFEELLGTLEHGYAPGELLYASQTLHHLIGVMIRHRRENWRSTPDRRQKVAQSIDYMKQHLGQPLRLSALAAMASLSPSHFSAVFKELTGYSPIDYLIRLRMHHACQLLDTTDLPVKEIAARLGYEDQLYFSRLFKVVNEVAPSDYRMLRKG